MLSRTVMQATHLAAPIHVQRPHFPAHHQGKPSNTPGPNLLLLTQGLADIPSA
jgi:hypothetical protein